ncbi:MAG: NADH-quinone oxidoreductase subunit H [Methanobacteriota archaeon]|nr:MAG: NADH-quinone oxidoreductase subunit H [Euryarchaeota archaeon]
MTGALIDLFGWSYALASFLLWIGAQLLGLGNWISLQLGAPSPGPLEGMIGFVTGAPLTSLVAIILAINILLLWATAFHLLIVMWIERKMYSRLQDRRGIMLGLGSSEILRNTLGRIPLIGRPFRKASHLGTGFLQTVADGVKLFQKEVITPASADKWMFHAAPVMIAASTLFLFIAIPWSDGFWIMGSRLPNGDVVNPWGVLVILGAFSVAPLSILIAGWASNNKYTLLGGMRAAAQLMSYEIPMVLSIIALVVFAGTLDPFQLVRQQSAPLTFGLGPFGTVQIPWLPNWYIFNPILWIAFVVFFITVIAEAERIPFDIPEAEAELVEGWTTEYSGMRFGIVFGFKWLRAIAGAALIAILFLGGWSGPVFAQVWIPNIASPGNLWPIPILPQEFWFTLKIYAIFVVFVWIGWSVPRVRIDQILNIGWKRLLPLSLLAILLATLARGMGWF